MTPEEHINLVKHRYGYLSITDNQAQQIIRFEHENRFSSTKHFFSDWEEMDFEWTTFRQILQDEQWKKYEQAFYTRKQSLENNFIETDKGTIKEIQYHQELLHYFKNTLFPELFTIHQNRTFEFFCTAEQSKLQYLKNEYKIYLKENRKMILTNHFRYYRTFRPNELKNSLIRHELGCVIPEYSYFKHQMDKPSRMVAKYIYKRMGYTHNEQSDLLLKKYNELEAFSEALLLKYHGPLNNVIYYGKLSAEEEKENRIMSLWLLDKDMYLEQ